MTNYDILRSYGFSAAKAGEIVLDIQRNDPYAIKIMDVVKSAVDVPSGAVVQHTEDADLTRRLIKLFGRNMMEEA